MPYCTHMPPHHTPAIYPFATHTFTCLPTLTPAMPACHCLCPHTPSPLPATCPYAPTPPPPPAPHTACLHTCDIATPPAHTHHHIPPTTHATPHYCLCVVPACLPPHLPCCHCLPLPAFLPAHTHTLHTAHTHTTHPHCLYHCTCSHLPAHAFYTPTHTHTAIFLLHTTTACLPHTPHPHLYCLEDCILLVLVWLETVETWLGWFWTRQTVPAPCPSPGPFSVPIMLCVCSQTFFRHDRQAGKTRPKTT